MSRRCDLATVREHEMACLQRDTQRLVFARRSSSPRDERLGGPELVRFTECALAKRLGSQLIGLATGGPG